MRSQPLKGLQASLNSGDIGRVGNDLTPCRSQVASANRKSPARSPENSHDDPWPCGIPPFWAFVNPTQFGLVTTARFVMDTSAATAPVMAPRSRCTLAGAARVPAGARVGRRLAVRTKSKRWSRSTSSSWRARQPPARLRRHTPDVAPSRLSGPVDDRGRAVVAAPAIEPSKIDPHLRRS